MYMYIPEAVYTVLVFNKKSLVFFFAHFITYITSSYAPNYF